jgi:hypothetical protein
MLAIEPRGGSRAQKKLRSVGVWPCIGHAQHARPVMLEREVLIVKRNAVDTFAACAIASREVTALAHKLRDDAVENASLVVQCLS